MGMFPEESVRLIRKENWYKLWKEHRLKSGKPELSLQRIRARLKNGEKAFELLKNQVNLTHTTEVDMSGGGIYPNLFCAHPPFQIDGNFGFAAAISEMLLQSQNNDIELLPAIPEQWKRGQIKGIKARGGYTVDFSWKNGKVYYIKISALKEGNVIVRYNGQISRFFFKEGQNKVCLQKTGRK